MKRLLLATVFLGLVVILSGTAQAQAPDVNGVCVANCGSGSSYSNGSLENSPFYQLGVQFRRWIFGSHSDPQAELQKRQMMEELQRRQAEAERQHREEEARRLAEMYNRLARTLKLGGLPNLQLKEMGSNRPGLQLKLGDASQGFGIQGLPGIYTNGARPDSGVTPQNGSKLHLKTGDDAGAQPYGIPGLPGIYTNGAGPGSGMTAPGQPGSRTMGAGENGTAPIATFDPSKMTPQQLADVAEMVDRLPPEAQQRLMAAAQNETGQPQPPTTMPSPGAALQSPALASTPTAPASSKVLTPQTAAQPVNGLQQQATASQSATATTVPEDASFKARNGFDTPLVSGSTQPITATTPERQSPASAQTPSTAATGTQQNPGSASAPMPSPHATGGQLATPNAANTPALAAALPPASPANNVTPEEGISLVKLFGDDDSASRFFPKDPNPALINPLREEQELQSSLKAWDDWAVQSAIHIPGEVYKNAWLNELTVKEYAPDLLDRYNADAAFRENVDLRLQATELLVALDYYQRLADAHKAALLAYESEWEKLAAAGTLDRLVSLGEQARLYPERRQIVLSLWNRIEVEEQNALTKAKAEGLSQLRREYQVFFQLIRSEAAQRR